MRTQLLQIVSLGLLLGAAPVLLGGSSGSVKHPVYIGVQGCAKLWMDI